ncbi:MAG: winged helix DNA-binding domain-containing protein [Anaerolineae bacterium]|nr:winged helix DNA-binding domain-containing protein [Anaerolineae bacterium]
MDINLTTILAERLRRQCLTHPLADAGAYLELFRRLQPVSPVAYTRPGDPPRLMPRTLFDDGVEADRLRAQRRMVKGRFLGGGIGYVLAEDLVLYANAFQRPLTYFSEIQEAVLEAVQITGPLTPRQLKEETGLLNKQIMPALHRLQQAFLVYEDQTDDDWERGWYDFAAEWPEVKLNEDRRQAATAQVLLQFLAGHVFATFEQLRDWSQLSQKLLVTVIQELEQANRLVSQTVEDLGEGWLRAEDTVLPEQKVIPAVFMLHKADFLVRSHTSELRRRFGGLEVLQYLLIDGQFQGAVVGHWRIGPHNVDDIVLMLPADERAKRREEIINVVAQGYHPPHHQILKYSGAEITGV